VTTILEDLGCVLLGGWIWRRVWRWICV